MFSMLASTKFKIQHPRPTFSPSPAPKKTNSRLGNSFNPLVGSEGSVEPTSSDMAPNGANSSGQTVTKDDLGQLWDKQAKMLETMQASLTLLTSMHTDTRDTVSALGVGLEGVKEEVATGLHAARQQNEIVMARVNKLEELVQQTQLQLQQIKQEQQQQQENTRSPRWGSAAAGRLGGSGGRGPRFVVPNSGRGGETSTSGSEAGAAAPVDRRAVIIKLRVGGPTAKQAIATMEHDVKQGLTTSNEVEQFGFKYFRPLGKEGQDMLARAEAASASSSGGGAAAGAAAAPSSGAGAGAQVGAQQDTYQVVAWFNTAWSDGSGWEELIRVAAQRKREGTIWGWGVKDYLTVEGRQARQAQQPHYARAREEGKEPVWRNGAEIWVRSNGPNSPHVLYRKPTPVQPSGTAHKPMQEPAHTITTAMEAD